MRIRTHNTAKAIRFFVKRAKIKPFSFRVAPPPPPPPGPWPRLSCSGRRVPGTALSHRPVLTTDMLAIYGHKIYMAPYVMFMMRANPLRGQVEGGLGPGNRDFFGPCEMDSSRNF
jgi:hypothetical protein